MATLIGENGTQQTVMPKNGRVFTLEELYQHTGCDYVETITVPGVGILVVDENGKAKARPGNLVATELAWHRLRPNDYIVGPALVCTPAEMGVEV